MVLHEYIPQKDPKRAGGLLIVLIAAAVGFFAFPMLYPDMPLRWVFQFSGLLCLVAIIFISTRYISRAVVYRLIENDEGGVDFTVTEVTNGGKSAITVCRFSLDNIQSAQLFFSDKKEDAERKKAFSGRARELKVKTFSYFGDVMPSVECWVICKENGETLLVKTTPDEYIWECFKKSADKS